MALLRKLAGTGLLVTAILTTATALAQEKSVNPGINKSFKKPDVTQFLGRFEREGREIFDKQKEIVAACKLKPGLVVADIGAGTGLFTRLFASQIGPKGRVYAVDIAQEFIDHIQRTCIKQGLKNVVGVVCKQDRVGLPPASIDLAFICATYHHFEFPTKTMRSIRQALRPDGQVIVIDLHRIEGKSSEWVLGHVRAGQETFTKEIVAAGFKQVEERNFLQENYFLRFVKANTAAAQKTGASTGTEKPLVPLPRKVPAPKHNPTTPAKVALGKQLFFDPRLSGDNRMSCATCHIPDKALADGLASAKGHKGKTLERNTPTVLNAGFFSTFLWDGRAASLEEQALGPILSPDEMNQDLDELERELNAVSGYVKQFQAVFGTTVNRDGIAKALAAFQRTLVSGPSPLDRYLAGEKQALSNEARRGLELFTGEAGCVRCHRGVLLSDQKFYRLGLSTKDAGRGKITGRKEDRYKFRTPSLRNVADTGPYMHNGSKKTLEDVVLFYFREVPATAAVGPPIDVEPLLGQSFSDMPAIVAFLESLSGKIPVVTPPKLP